MGSSPSMTPQLHVGTRLLVPSSAKTSDFTSLLVVLNMDSQDNVVRITARRTDGSVIGAPITRTLPVNGRFRSLDILGELGGGLNEFGPVTVESTNGRLLAAISEVSSSRGTAGFFPAVNVNKAWTEGVIAEVVDTGSKGGSSGTFRTNLGLNTVDPIPANVSVVLLDDLGNQMGSTLNEVVPGNGMTQKNNIIRLLLGSGGVTGQSGYLRITSNRPIHAWASKIENGTDDPSMEIGIEVGRSVGEWAPLQSLPFAPVHSILLPTGQVMIYRQDDSLSWDPANGSLAILPRFGYDPLCAGHVLIADGRVMFTGGNIAPNVGEAFASYYDPFSSTFRRLPDMAAARWYPSQVTLASGDVVTISGDIDNARNLIPEVWEVNTETWRILSGASFNLPLYPAAFLAPNGRVFVASDSSQYLDTSGTGGWEAVAPRQASGRDDYGSACMYDVGRVIYTGGGDAPIATSEGIDLAAATPAWSLVAPMPEPRRQHNTTILPDGRVLVTGGSSSAGFNTEDGPKAAIVWDPDTNGWTTWAAEDEYRGYHSGAILLPDGRVATIGGDDHPSLQVFSPPYLFKGPRPTMISPPASVRLGETFFVETPDSAEISRVTWVRPGAVTHTKNMNQRINKLSFTPVSGGLNVTAPASASVCPPGHYLMFLINANGVPSVAPFVQVSLGSP